MPADNRVFIATRADDVDLLDFRDTVILRLRFPEQGNFVMLGKVVITNIDDSADQNATVRLTTLDGETELDRAEIRIGKGNDSDNGAQSVSLQATLSLPADTANEIVDLRCSTSKGHARFASLFAVQVGDLKKAGV